MQHQQQHALGFLMVQELLSALAVIHGCKHSGLPVLLGP
jgi:hypothetical protein